MDNSSRLQDDVRVLKEDFGQLRTDMADLMQTLVDATKSEAGDARKRLEDEASQRLAQMRDGIEEARRQGERAAATVEQKIEDRPFLSVVGAFGVGLLVGKLLDGRK